MYDRYFDDSTDYTSKEVLNRAYALGVASVCGDPDDGEYERLKRASPDAYDETIVELAYEEGRASALELEAEEAIEAETVWERLVEREFEGIVPEKPSLPDGLPEALGGFDQRGPRDGPPDRLDLPSFLRR